MQIALGHYEAAATFVAPALAVADKRGLFFRVAELSILQALIHKRRGNVPAAMEALGLALRISEPRGYTRLFDDGPELDSLLCLAVEKKVHAKYAKQLLVTFQPLRANRMNVPARTDGGLIDPLSERELEVLRMLAGGLTPAEVAKRLFLSPFTLKAHTQNIYSKLSVHSRIEAINKARELQMI